MAYVNVTSVAGPTGVVQAIRDFAINTLTGWSSPRDMQAPQSGEGSSGGNDAGGLELVLVKNNIMVGLRSTTTAQSAGRIFMWDGLPPWTGLVTLDQLPGNSGILTSDTQYNQASVTATTRHCNKLGIGTFPNVYLFGANSPKSYIHCVIEFQSGSYAHLAFGEMDKVGTWTGGEYYGAGFWSQGGGDIDIPQSIEHQEHFTSHQYNAGTMKGSIRCVTTSPTSNWLVMGSTTNAIRNSVQTRASTVTGPRGEWMSEQLMRIRTSPFSGLTPLVPIQVFFLDIGLTPDVYHYLGQIRDVRGINMTTLTPAELITIGGDDWMVFPMRVRNGAAASENSSVLGFAYKKIP